MARVEVAGPETMTSELLAWLRYGVEILNESGTRVWGGYVHQVQAAFGGLIYTVSLDQVINRVQVIYSYEDGDGSQAAGATAWAEDALSVERYGPLEHVEPAADTAADMALRIRDTILGERAWPQMPPTAGQLTGAVLYLRGWSDLLRRQYYKNSNGRFEYVTGNDTAPLGLGFQSDSVGLSLDRRIHEISGKLRHFRNGMQIMITGSASNDGMKHLDGSPSADETESYMASTISFDPDDDMRDSASGLGFLRNREMVRITGSASNDGFGRIDSDGASNVTLNVGFSGLRTAEAAGNAITIEQGIGIGIIEEPVTENPAANGNVTVTGNGQKIAQIYTHTGAAWPITHVAVEIGAVGDPADDVTLKWYTDASGAGPGSLLAGGTIDGAAVGTAHRYVWVALSQVITPAPGTSYWIVLERSGSMDPEHFFEIGIDEEGGLGGGLRLWTGSGWTVPAQDLRFRLRGMIDSAALAEEIADAAANVAHVEVRTAAGVATAIYRDGEGSLWAELDDATAAGTAAGDQMIWRVDRDRNLIVEAAPSALVIGAVWTREKRLVHEAGGALPPGVLPVGQWIRIGATPPVAGASKNSPQFLTAAGYDANSDQVTPTFGESLKLEIGRG